MQKIKTVFVINYSNPGRPEITREVTSGNEWVVNREGVATRKWDGTAVRVFQGNLFRRYDAKTGRTPPPDFEPCEPVPDPITGHWPGWIPVRVDDPAAKHIVATHRTLRYKLADGTYEFVGPTVNANPEKLDSHEFRRHGDVIYDVPRTFDGIQAFLTAMTVEGIVFHHPDGRMAKIRRSDFGITWNTHSKRADR